MILHPDHTKGAANELKVEYYYLQLGCQVYRPVVQQGLVDMVVEKPDGSLSKIQVKTAYPNQSGGRYYLQCRTRTSNKYQVDATAGYCDTFAVVYEHELWLIPAVEIKSSNISLRTETKVAEQWHKYKVS